MVINSTKMKKTVKTELKETVGLALNEMLEDLKISKPSKKTKKAIAKVSKALRADVKASIKRAEKASKKKNKANPPK